MDTYNKNQRVIWADFLKILSIFMVIVLHISTKNMWQVNVGDRVFTIFTLYSLITRWAVPVFFMVSGSFLLNPEKEISNSKIKKYIFRLVVAFIGWSFVYAIFNTFIAWDFSWDTAAERIWTNFYTGPYHFWFLFVMLGMYIILPMLRKICKISTKKELEYFLLIFCIFTVILPTLKKMEILNVLVLWLDNLKVSFVTGYVGLYVLGYYLKKYPFCKTNKGALCTLFVGVISLVLSAVLTFVWEHNTGMRDEFWQGNLNITVVPQAVAIYSLVQYFDKWLAENKVIVKFTNLVASKIFIIYLCHDIFISLLEYWNFTTIKYNSLWSIPLFSIVVFLCSFIMAYICELCIKIFSIKKKEA